MIRGFVKHTTPTRLLYLYTIKEFVEEVEIFGNQVIAKLGGAVGDDLPFQVVLDGVEVGVVDNAVEGCDEIGRCDIETVKCRSPNSIKVGVPVEDRCGGLQLPTAHDMIEVVGILAILYG